MSANSTVVSRWFERPLIAVGILAVGLIVGVLVITLPSVGTRSVAVVRENENIMKRSIDASRGAGFDFADHELRVAGGYGLVAAEERGAGFDFMDHELRHAGGYTLAAATK